MAAPTSRRAFLLHALSLPAWAALPGCGGGSSASPPAEPVAKFTPDGLQGRIVRKLRPGAAGLLAATDDSAWRRGPAGWTSLGLPGLYVQDIAAFSATRLVASVKQPAPATGPERLLETLDGGLSWHDVAHDFGGPGTPEFIQALLYDAPAGRLLAIGSDALAASSDQGRHWELLAGQWHAFASGKDALAVQPVSGDVWYGGQDAIETLVLKRRRAAGGALDSYPALLPSPSVAKGIRFGIGEPQRVLVAGEGGIVQTRDNGATWQTLLLHADYRFHFDVLQDPARPRRLVSASWKKEYELPQPLIVAISEDEGATWRSIEHPDRQLHGGAWSMALQVEEGRSVFYFGLHRGGVMRMTLE